MQAGTVFHFGPIAKEQHPITPTLATTTESLNELFQNASRANATRVDVSIRVDVSFNDGLVTVTDDGEGIPDPEDILAFGHSGWDDTTVQREDPGSFDYCLTAPIKARGRDGWTAWRRRAAAMLVSPAKRITLMVRLRRAAMT